MNEERELLELAAKAIGRDVFGFDRYGNACMDPVVYDPWNPLSDDGDALRLAVKLYLCEAIRMAHRLVTDKLDIYAATRLSIVRAAAEIGRSQL